MKCILFSHISAEKYGVRLCPSFGYGHLIVFFGSANKKATHVESPQNGWPMLVHVYIEGRTLTYINSGSELGEESMSSHVSMGKAGNTMQGGLHMMEFGVAPPWNEGLLLANTWA